MMPKIRVFAKAGVKAVFGGGYDRDQMFYEIRDVDFYDKDVTVWGCHRKDCGMCEDTYKIEDVEVMMSTGLKDKNDVEIFEGDIVKYTWDSPSDINATEKGKKVRISKVFWSDWRASWAVGKKSSNSDLFRYIRNGNTVEVIGNIWEGEELMEVAE